MFLNYITLDDILPIPKMYRNRIMCYVSFCVWPLLLTIAVKSINNSFLSFFTVHFTNLPTTNLFIHSPLWGLNSGFSIFTDLFVCLYANTTLY